MLKLSLVAGMAAVIAGLGGCATPRQSLTQEQYNWVANQYNLTHQCGVVGMISAETAAAGKGYISQALGIRYQVTPEQRAAGQEYVRRSGETPTTASCNRVAMEIAGIQQKERGQQEAAAQTYRPTYTTCNRVFGQVNCTTY